ncbi:hypothetical protein RD792_000919 [Penstemon davidsonii]|uniref:Uncharacterized protein n=1 Tax=Penstemon davidsonii TaxID=160366 RepID=A0ABR0DM16_9LAMI|nr:hypothetical protein RD792_000919 [Penstemon davidsonii]
MTVPAIFAFGDSIVDQGTNNVIKTLVKCNFPPYGKDFEGGLPTGRFSNGKTPPDLIAEELGITNLIPAYLDPKLNAQNLQTGVSFASGGCGYDPQTPILVSVISLSEQLEQFKEYIGKLKGAIGEERTNFVLSNGLFLVVAGSDDLANTYFTIGIRRAQYDISSYGDLIVASASNFTQELYKLGARRIGVFGTPPIGCLPSQRTLAGGALRDCAEDYNQAAQLVNVKLSNVLASLGQKLPQSRVVYIDIYNPFLDIIQHPQNYGFEVSDKGCCGTGNIEVVVLCNKYSGTCSDASKYIFWDSYHPTEKAYSVLANSIIKKYLNNFFTCCDGVIQLPKNFTVPALFAFGDSIVDQGNNNLINTPLKCNYPPYGKDFEGGLPTGRFSNGKTLPDLIGSNDLANTYFTIGIPRAHYDISSYGDLLVASASSFIKELYKLGARRIGVFGTPPIGCLPFQRTIAGGVLRMCAENQNQAAQLVNVKLSSELNSCEGVKNLPENVKVPAVFAFGDSLADTGNNNPLKTPTKSNFPPYAEGLGVKELIPAYNDPYLNSFDMKTGVSFASGGSGYDPLTPKITLAIPLSTQLELFKDYIQELKGIVGEEEAQHTLNHSIYLLISGNNDVAKYFNVGVRRIQYDIFSYADLLEMYRLGARKIAVFSVIPVGCLPAERTVLGFEVVDRACCGTGLIEAGPLCNKLSGTCSNDSKYLFWDSDHPTEAGYTFLIEQILPKYVNSFV